MRDLILNPAAIPVVGLGTWTLKGDLCSELVSYALSLGYRHVDTVSDYDNENAIAVFRGA